MLNYRLICTEAYLTFQMILAALLSAAGMRCMLIGGPLRYGMLEDLRQRTGMPPMLDSEKGPPLECDLSHDRTRPATQVLGVDRSFN